MSNLKEKLNALKQVREKATQGEWDIPDFVDNPTSLVAIANFQQLKNDAEFIHTASNEWTSLIEALESAIESMRDASGELDNLEDSMEPEIHNYISNSQDILKESLIKIDALLSRKDGK